MIRHIDLPTSIAPGSRGTLRVFGDEPIQVEVKCFLRRPPPGRYSACASCQKWLLRDGEEVHIEASQTIFAAADGELRVHIVDSQHDTRDVAIPVKWLVGYV